jgi:16S rRNA (cytidine1402-2'-O)-methyltransferase
MLYLIPTPLSENRWQDSIPESIIPLISGIRLFFVEDIRTARRFLRKVDPAFPIDDSTFVLINEHNPLPDAAALKPLTDGVPSALLSEAGLPGVADPGQFLVAHCHARGIAVTPISGPNSIILALAASGLNGQQFSFHGYLPKDKQDRKSAIDRICRECQHHGYTQIFIETPYRNTQLYTDLLAFVPDQLKLCIAVDITGPQERITCKPVKQWKQHTTSLPDKLPAVFLIGQ